MQANPGEDWKTKHKIETKQGLIVRDSLTVREKERAILRVPRNVMFLKRGKF
jgi:hypothetical protein